MTIYSKDEAIDALAKRNQTQSDSIADLQNRIEKAEKTTLLLQRSIQTFFKERFEWREKNFSGGLKGGKLFFMAGEEQMMLALRDSLGTKGKKP